MRSIIEFFSGKMDRPKSYGMYHFIWVIVSLIFIIIFYKNKKKYSDKDTKRIIFIYSIVSLILELIKQVIWSYDLETGVWEYSFYSAPFQLCSTPMYALMIAVFTKNNKLRDSIFSYVSFITILGSLATAIYR